MASKQQKKEQKKKVREQENRQKLLIKRAAKTKLQQEEKAEFHKNKRIEKLQKELGELSQWSDQILKKVPDETLTQLEKNAKMLRALEDEYEQEHAKKRQLNESLESEGVMTLEQKMAKLHEGLAQSQIESGALSSCIDHKEVTKTVRVPRAKKDVAEVEIVRAPNAESQENSASS